MDPDEIRSPTPLFPLYGNARHFMRILEGVPYALYRSTHDAIMEQRGSPQEPVSWTDPDTWIPERLEGEEQALALRLWTESGRSFNPRHQRGSWYLTQRRGLMERDGQDVLRITERGRRFLDEPEGAAVAEIDGYEGLLTILRLVAERGPGRRSDLLPPYTDYSRTFTTHRSDSVIKSSLYARLANLIDRGYVTRRAQTYQVTEAGLAYLEAHAGLVPGRAAGTKQGELRRLGREASQEARDQLADYLASMHPYKFEGLIQLLLEQMDYTEVETTSPSNDKGVDVVGNIELGVSSVREVVQVKRHKGNVGRPVLDQLRGSLHRFDAVRGTIITTGGFSRGTIQAAFERGAAPITLIDREKLLDLLIEHGIGVRKTSIDYIEFDPGELAQFAAEEAEGTDI